MVDPRTTLLALAPPPGGEPHPFATFLLPAVIFGIFYFIVIQPARSRQKKLEALVKGLKAGDKVIVNPGIFGVVVAVEEDALLVRVDEKTKIKVLKSAVSGLQDQPRTEKK